MRKTWAIVRRELAAGRAAVVVAAAVVVGASGASPPDSSPDEAVVETRLPPVSPSPLQADARTTVPTITSTIA